MKEPTSAQRHRIYNEAKRAAKRAMKEALKRGEDLGGNRVAIDAAFEVFQAKCPKPGPGEVGSNYGASAIRAGQEATREFSTKGRR